MGSLTIVLVTISIIGLCSALPISLPTESIATGWLMGSVFMLGAALITVGGCLCCKRKKGFKEFNNEPGSATHTVSAESPFPIFRPLAQPTAQPIQNSNENQSEITPLNHPESPILPHNNITSNNQELIGQFSTEEPVPVDNLETNISPERSNNFESSIPRQHISPINNLASIRNNMQIISNAIINIVTHDQIEIDNNNGPISELDIQNIANNNAEGYIRNQNEIYENQNLETRNENQNLDTENENQNLDTENENQNLSTVRENQNLETGNENQNIVPRIESEIMVTCSPILENMINTRIDQNRSIYAPSTSSGDSLNAPISRNYPVSTNFIDATNLNSKLDAHNFINGSFSKDLPLCDIPQNRNFVENGGDLNTLNENMISIDEARCESPKFDDKSNVDDVNEALRVLESVLSGESDCDSASCSSLAEIQLDFGNDDVKTANTDFENVDTILDVQKTQDLDESCVINLDVTENNTTKNFENTVECTNLGNDRIADGPMSESCIVNFDESEIRKHNNTTFDLGVKENVGNESVAEAISVTNVKINEIENNSNLMAIDNQNENSNENDEKESILSESPIINPENLDLKNEVTESVVIENKIDDLPQAEFKQNMNEEAKIDLLEDEKSEKSSEPLEIKPETQSNQQILNETSNKENIDTNPVVKDKENTENIKDNFLDDIATSDVNNEQLQNSGSNQIIKNIEPVSINSTFTKDTISETLAQPEKIIKIDTRAIEVLESLNLQANMPSESIICSKQLENQNSEISPPFSKILANPEKTIKIDTKAIEVLESMNIKTSTPTKVIKTIENIIPTEVSIRKELLQKNLPFTESPKKPNYDFLKSGQINLESWDKFLGDSFERSNEEDDFEFDNLEEGNENKILNNTYTKENQSVGDIADITGDEFFYIPQGESSPNSAVFEKDFQNKENLRHFGNESTFSPKEFEEECWGYQATGEGDEENLAAIRRALIISLPDAQGPKTKEVCSKFENGTKSAQNTPDNVQVQKRNILGVLEDAGAGCSFQFPDYFINDGNTEERNEVYIRYNTAGRLTPILEDWLGEGNDEENSQNENSNLPSDELKISESSESAERTFIIVENQGDSTSYSDRSAITSDKPRQVLGSWCSNDTLFNVEDTLDIEKISSPAENNDNLVQKFDFPNSDIEESPLKEDSPMKETVEDVGIITNVIEESYILDKTQNVDLKNDIDNEGDKDILNSQNFVKEKEGIDSNFEKSSNVDIEEKLEINGTPVILERKNSLEHNAINLKIDDGKNLAKTASENETDIIVETIMVTEIQDDINTQNKCDKMENLDTSDFSKPCISENFSKTDSPVINSKFENTSEYKNSVLSENSTNIPVEILCNNENIRNLKSGNEQEDILEKSLKDISKTDTGIENFGKDLSDKENGCVFNSNIKKINCDFLSNEQKHAETKFLENSETKPFLDKASSDLSNKKYLVKKSSTKINFFPNNEEENIGGEDMKILENFNNVYNGSTNANEDDSSSEHENEDTISSNTDDYDTLTSSSQSGQEYELQGDLIEEDEKLCELDMAENRNFDKNTLNLDGENDPWTSNIKFSDNDLMTTSFSSESPMISPQSADCVQTKFAENQQNTNFENLDDDTGWESEDTSGEFEWKSGDQENLQNLENTKTKVDQILEEPMETVTETEENGEDEDLKNTNFEKDFENNEESPVDSAKASTEDLDEKDGEENDENDEYDESSDESEEIEFIPSTWNSSAAPTRSSLKSPENNTADKKGRSVVFKKEKYLSVYEYPREQEHCTYIEPMYDNSLSYAPNGPVLCFDRFFVTSTTLPFNEYEFYPTNSDTSKDFDTTEQFNWLSDQENPFDSEDLLNSVTDFDLQGTLDTEYKIGDDQFSLDPMPGSDRLYEFTDQNLDEFEQDSGAPWSNSNSNEEVTSFMSPDTPDSNNSQINARFRIGNKKDNSKMSDFATPDSGIEITPNPDNCNMKFSEITTIDCSDFNKKDIQKSVSLDEKAKESKEFNNIDNLGTLCHTKRSLKLPLKIPEVKDSSENLDSVLDNKLISTNSFEEKIVKDGEINEQDSVDEFENNLNVLKQVLDSTKTNEKIQNDLLLSDVGSANSGDEDSGIDSATTLIDVNNRS